MKRPVTSSKTAMAWVWLYSLGLAPEVRDARMAEIASDIYEQLTEQRSSNNRLLPRMARGVGGDLIWRNEEMRIMKQQEARTSILGTIWAVVAQSWFAPVATLVGMFNVLLAAGIFFQPEGTLPGKVVGPAVILVLTIGLFFGLKLRFDAQSAWSGARAGSGSHASRSFGQSAAIVTLCAVTVGALAIGVIGSFIGLFVGILTLAACVVLIVRSKRRSHAALATTGNPQNDPHRDSFALATVLIVLGTLPALAMFWLVIPATAALVVIGGLLFSGVRSPQPVATE